MTDRNEKIKMPSREELEKEISRKNKNEKISSSFKRMILFLLVAASLSIVMSNFLFPVFRIFGHSMYPTLNTGEYVVALKTNDCKQGDVIAFYYNNKVLVKRVIATSGQWVDIDKDGNVFVDHKFLNEPYVINKSFNKCNITLPHQVPANSVFVMGDNRIVSIDSRMSEIGDVSKDNIIGKVVFKIYPFNKTGFV